MLEVVTQSALLSMTSLSVSMLCPQANSPFQRYSTERLMSSIRLAKPFSLAQENFILQTLFYKLYHLFSYELLLPLQTSKTFLPSSVDHEVHLILVIVLQNHVGYCRAEVTVVGHVRHITDKLSSVIGVDAFGIIAENISNLIPDVLAVGDTIVTNCFLVQNWNES